MLEPEKVNKRQEIEQSIFKRTYESLKNTNFDGDDQSWEAAYHLTKNLSLFGHVWSILSWDIWRFRMEVANRRITEHGVNLDMDGAWNARITRTANISVQFSLRKSDSFTFNVFDSDLNWIGREDGLIFILWCIEGDRTRFFILPYWKIQKEIQNGIPRNANDNGYTLAIVTKSTDEIQEAFIKENETRLTYYLNNFRIIRNATSIFPISISPDLEECFMNMVPSAISDSDMAKLIKLDEFPIALNRHNSNGWAEYTIKTKTDKKTGKKTEIKTLTQLYWLWKKGS